MAEYNYAALAGTMKIEDITSDKHNQTILQRLKDNDTSLDKLLICEDIEIFGEGTTSDYYVPDFDNVEELGWLGYYIGQNSNLQKLHFYDNQTNVYSLVPNPSSGVYSIINQLKRFTSIVLP